MAEYGDAAPPVERPRIERRAPSDRRYNRRTPPVSETAPPYFELFQRIAVALEGIESGLVAHRAPDGDQDRSCDA